jgi:hypothetical protein
MILRDLIIIYLACGAPFGVYYFLQQRNLRETNYLWLKSLIRFVCWIPFACRMVARKSLFTNLYNNTFDKHSISDAKKEVEIAAIQKCFENTLREYGINLSIYEFREIFERYVGLTLEIKSETTENTVQEKEIFRITNHNNKKLAEICLHRRNRKRLFFHQNLARRDFFEVLEQLREVSETIPQSFFKEAAKLVNLLDDSEARNLLEKLSKNTLQTRKASNVSNLENELWNSGKQKPLQDKIISTNMQVLTATAQLSPKD